MRFVDIEDLSRRVREPGFREVFEDAVRELDLGTFGAWIAARLRGDDRVDAAEALRTWSRVLSGLGMPLNVPVRELDTAHRVIEAGDREWRTTPRTVFISSPWPGLPARAVESTYDSIRAGFRIEADRVERYLGALRWLEELQRHRHPIPTVSEPLRVFKNGRVVGRSQDLAGVTSYAKRAKGVTLIVLERVGDGFNPNRGGGALHLYFHDGATLSTSFGSYEHMETWLSNKLRNRTSWLAGAPIARLDPPVADRDFRRRS